MYRSQSEAPRKETWRTSALSEYSYKQKQSPGGVLQKRCEVEACNFIKKDTLAQVFSCEFCEISKNS